MVQGIKWKYLFQGKAVVFKSHLLFLTQAIYRLKLYLKWYGIKFLKIDSNLDLFC